MITFFLVHSLALASLFCTILSNIQHFVLELLMVCQIRRPSVGGMLVLGHSFDRVVKISALITKGGVFLKAQSAVLKTALTIYFHQP